MLMKLKVADRIQSDATFIQTVKFLSALYNLHIVSRTFYFSHSRILMQSKKEDLYAIVLIKIGQIIPEFSLSITAGDFERAPRNVFSHYFPEINIVGLIPNFKNALV